MTSNLANNSENECDTGCAIIETDGRRTQLTVQELQDVYNQITGKTEELSKVALIPFELRIHDLQQLNTRIHQLFEQYNVQSTNCDVTVNHLEDRKEVYSGFDRFAMYDTSNLSPVEEVVLNYNFLILLPKLRKPQSYSITVRLASQVAVQRKIEEERPFPNTRFLVGRNVKISIRYVDYLVARNFMEALINWTNALPQLKQPKVISTLKKYSHYIPRITKYFGLAGASILVLMNAPRFIPAEASALPVFFQVSLYSALCIFLTYRFTLWLGRLAEDQIDNSYALSSIQLNRGDENLLTNARYQNKWKLIRGVLAFGFSFAVAILQNVIASLITQHNN